MQVDPEMESTANLGGYIFGGDNPATFVDPTGLRMNYKIPGPPNFGSGDHPDPDGLFDGVGGGAGGGGGGFFSYMDGNGNKWHHADPLAGTGAAGQPYRAGYGLDGFGNDNYVGDVGGIAGNSGNYASYWNELWRSVPAGQNNTFTNDPSLVNDLSRPYGYANSTGAYNSRHFHGHVFDDPEIGQTFVLTKFKGLDITPSWYSWDGSIFRSLTPDFLSIGVGFNGIAGIGAGSSIEFQWVLHGPEASWKPAVTATQSIGGGFSVDATINLGSARYSGKASDINRKMLATNTFGKGDFPTLWGSGGITALGKIGITGTATYTGSGNYIYGGQLNFGGGLPAGPLPGNGAAGVSNAWILYDFYAK